MRTIKALIQASEEAFDRGDIELSRKLAKEAAALIAQNYPEVYGVICRAGSLLLKCGGF